MLSRPSIWCLEEIRFAAYSLHHVSQSHLATRCDEQDLFNMKLRPYGAIQICLLLLLLLVAASFPGRPTVL